MRLSGIGHLSCLFVIIAAMFLHPNSSMGETPDFAFPEKVEKTAASDLKAALKADDGKGVVSAMIRLGLAKSQVNTDSLGSVLRQVSSLTAREQDPSTRALLNLLSATIYRQIYSAGSWTYDERQTVSNAGEDYKLWSRGQFLDKVSELTEASLADRKALQQLPISDFKDIINIDAEDVKFYPTLFDFVANAGIDNLDEFASSGELRVLNQGLLEDPGNPRLRPGDTCRPLGQILAIYASVADFHQTDVPSLFMEEIDVRKFIDNHLFSPSSALGRRNAIGLSLTPLSPYASAMYRLYEQNKENEFSGLFLLEMAKDYESGTDENAKELYGLLVAYRSRFPDSFLKNNIDNCIDNLSRPSARIYVPGEVTKGEDVTMKIESVNGKSVKVELFNLTGVVPVSSTDDWINTRLTVSPIETKALTFDKEVPFSETAKVVLRFPSYGVYAIRISVDGKQETGGYRIIRCTDLTLSAVTVGKNASAWVANAISGAPVDGANFSFKPWSRRLPESMLPGTTDKEGRMTLDIKEYGVLSAKKGEDAYSPGINVSTPNGTTGNPTDRIEIFTSLGLYRPGDEVDFALVAYRNEPLQRKILAGQKIGVELRDVNFQAVDTVVVTTDSWGRGEGKFTLPSGGLTGIFQLRAGKVKGASLKDIDFIGSQSIEVSDYKLPTFELKTETINRPASLNDSASVRIKAVTYSGFPVADAKVKASLTVQQGYWWWKTVSPVFFTAETVTDSEGGFTVVIPSEVISSSPAPNGLYKLLVAVTSADGETREITATFNMGKPLNIVASIPSQINLAMPFQANVESRDANGATRQIDLNCKVFKDSTVIRESTIPSGSVAEIIKQLPTGSYSLEFAPVDTTLADTAAPCDVIVYRPNDPVCPVAAPLWIPSGDIMADADGTARLIIGSDCDDSYVRMIAAVYPGEIISQRWLRPRKGMQEIEVVLPPGAESATVNLACVKDYELYEGDIAVKATSTLKSIKLEIETFRDKVTPGDEERITFRVVPSDGATVRSAMFLDMANKAIDILSPNPMRLSSFSPRRCGIRSNGWQFDNFSSSVVKDFRFRDQWRATSPTLQLYGFSFTGGGMRNLRIRGSRMYKSAATAGSASEDVAWDVDEHAELMENVAMAAPAMGVAVTADTADAGSDEAEGTVESDVAEDGGNYRPSEIPLAFFRPMLTTAEDGTIEVSYTVPDANTTWILRGMAYDMEMLTATTSAEIVSSKPVMVSQNSPRFLRTGDSATLASSVMNNTDSVRVIKVVSEILSSADNRPILHKEESFELTPMGACVTTIDVTVPSDATGLIYRVKATSGNFTDGEQTLLPILPSEQDVVESRMFYIAPDQSRFEIDLPAMGDDERAFLNFTENPSWQIVSALPGLLDNKINSTTEASASLFSAAVADGIMKDNPEIARVLRRWLETGDSALVSNLQKNDELKSMLLSSTPWVTEALSDTERMQRLALIFDKRQTRKMISEAIDRLARNQIDGGWSWSPDYPRVSRWATEVVLEELGDLNRMGWLPNDGRLKKMINDACAYLDRETVKDFRKYPDADYWLYVIIRDMFPDVKLSTAASRVVEAEVQKALAKWKDSPIPLKAIYALILNNHGYNASARQILASLREYATSTPEKGMWWQQLDRYVTLWSYDRIGITALLLDAFNSVEPSCDDVDKIRQWLILNKTNNDWGNAVMTTQTVSAILASGKPLKVNTRGTAIHIGDTLVEPQESEYATGAFTEQITPLLAKPEQLTIDRQADYPSVGGVVMLRRLDMDSIQGVACQEIAVEKSLCLFNGSEWTPTDRFDVGDRVRVELTLRVEDDLSYVVIEDLRAAGLEPVEQLPAPISSEGLWFYRENRDSQTNIFIDFLPRGTYRLAYELFASQAGKFSSGVAQVQSQYNPIVAAHSGGKAITIKQ